MSLLTWSKVAKRLERERQELLEDLAEMRDPIDAAEIRGQIAQIKHILDDYPSTPELADD
ncbi:hypothetical protein [Paraferrimonas sedimenticola]|uniref:Uncharacterized protein n=1 Tax=Paraferrimonas sedimenticola TaxID=375674 RepID=A0AA37W0D9_9GAMM|nr:hypothetical protein [Paraferrimonas sedimenticola]GLP95293.1 hypothetical protein GCM10007895_05990 [Paraferrimonas sedimenticola]